MKRARMHRNDKSTHEEDSMKSQDQKDENSGEGRAYPTRSHELLGMTHEELLCDMAAKDETEEEFLAMLSRVEAGIPGGGAREAAKAPRRKAASAPEPEAFVSSLRFFDESVAAGLGTFFSDDPQQRAATLVDFFGKQAWDGVIVARVSGWSMKDAQIADGDVVLVDTRRKAKDGDLVLVHLADRGQLVKRLRVRNGRPSMLESANDAFEPIDVGDVPLTIQGVVVGRAGQL